MSMQAINCMVSDTWALDLAVAHCLMTPADQAALRRAVITGNSSLCPEFYRDAYLQVNCALGRNNWVPALLDAPPALSAFCGHVPTPAPQEAINCRAALAAVAEISYPYFRVVFDACNIPY